MLTVREAALHATVSEGLIRSWLASGQLAHYRVGASGKRGKILIQVEDLDGLMAAFKIGPPPAAPRTPVAKRTAFKHLKL